MSTPPFPSVRTVRRHQSPLRSKTAEALCLAALALTGGSLNAAEPPVVPPTGGSSGAPSAPAKESSMYDKIWKLSQWYKNDENPVIQSFVFTGRFQLDYARVEADQGDHDEWNIRRFRLGAKAKLFKDFTLHGEVELNPQEATPAYTRLTDMYLGWSRSEAFSIKVGKQSASFTMDGSTSSKELLAIDRGNVANNLWYPQEYIPGVNVSGEISNWIYQAGIYSSGEMDKEFGEFNAGYFLLGSVGYNFAELLGVKDATLKFDYVHNDPDAGNTFTRNLEHVASVNFKFEQKKWGVRTDLSAGQGYLGQQDMWGGMVMPFYNITDKLQAVARYEHIESDEARAIRLPTYENIVVTGRGDQYDAVYGGLNYYFYKHKLKLQTGVQYAEMEDSANRGGDYTGWSWVTGLRISW